MMGPARRGARARADQSGAGRVTAVTMCCRRSYAALLLVVALALGAGCVTRAPVQSAIPPSSAPGGAIPEGEVAASRRLSAEGAGALRLGSPAADIRRIPGLTVRETALGAVPGLHLSRYGVPVAVVELRDGRCARLHVRAPEYRTAEGAGVGSRARELEERYGPPTALAMDAGEVCAMFPSQAGLRFCFRELAGGGALPRWHSLRERDARVERVIVEGARSEDPARGAGTHP